MESDEGPETESDLDIGQGCEDKQGTPVAKRVKAGASSYKSKFKPDWKKTWPFIKEVKRDPYKVFCSICNKQVSCSHMGVSDVVRHVEGAIHKAKAKSLRVKQLLNSPVLLHPHLL